MLQIGMKEINDRYSKEVEDHFEKNQLTNKAQFDYLNNSTAKYHGMTISYLYIPKLFPEAVVDFLCNQVTIIYSILDKVIREYLTHEDYRALFGFDKRLEELILIDRLYKTTLPIARVDIFLNEEDLSYKFCEFNADGSSSMNDDRELNISIKYTDAYQRMQEHYDLDSFELFDSWVEEFMNIYSTYQKKVDKPKVAIVDFLEKGASLEEFEQFRQSFIKAGYQAEVCEIRDLRYASGQLYSPSGMPIDAIYRRAVTSDIMEHLEEIPDFIQAVREQKVCLIGSFCTQVIHNKILFKLLFEERTQRFLTEEERQFIKEHIPYTVSLSETDCNMDEIIENKNRWIIKPEDSYGAQGVFAGIHYTRKEWEQIIKEHLENHYMLQEFHMPYQSRNVLMNEKYPQFKNYSNLMGLYVYNGKFKGVYSRLSGKEIISVEQDENDAASVIVKEKQ